MPSRDAQTLTIGSPFKFGFYAGIGFFFASALMTCISAILFMTIGLGTIIGFFTAAHQSQPIAPVQSSVYSQSAAADLGR